VTLFETLDGPFQRRGCFVANLFCRFFQVFVGIEAYIVRVRLLCIGFTRVIAARLQSRSFAALPGHPVLVRDSLFVDVPDGAAGQQGCEKDDAEG